MIKGVTVSGDWCREHDVDLPISARIRNTRTREQLGGRPRNPRPSEIKRQLMERYELAVQRPYWRTLGYDVVIVDGECELVELPGGGAKLFGESKDGFINVSDVEDLGAQINASEKLEDRVYGRPKQATEITMVTPDLMMQAIERMEGELAGNDPTGPEHPAGADRAVQAAADSASGSLSAPTA